MHQSDRIKLYRELLWLALPRILSELDRDPFSLTYGSFDREYWAWATKDFSNVDLQRAIYPLALLYCTEFAGNNWAGHPRLLDWIKAAFGFWSRSRHRDGSHDHHYPHEFSFVGEAFTLYEISEAFQILVAKGALDQASRAVWVEQIGRSADFLCRSDELHGFISNHRVGAACGLVAAFAITGEDRFLRRCEELMDSVRLMQSKEGWLFEYGGADPGYQTLDTYYLANYVRLSGDDEILDKVVRPSLRFLLHFVHPDGSVGGEYGSRNCTLFFPSGFELLANRIPEAEAIAAVAAAAIAQNATPTVLGMDIRNFVPMLSSYTQAATLGEGTENPTAELPFRQQFERYWPKAGLYVRSDKQFYTIVGCSKGGVIKVFDKQTDRLVASHAGYMLVDTRGAISSNQFLADVKIVGAEDCSDIAVPVSFRRTLTLSVPCFHVMSDRTMSTSKFLLFRLFTYTVGRHRAVADWFKRAIITARYIHRRKRSSITLARTFSFIEKKITIDDRFESFQGGIARVRAGDFFTTIYMASSRYFRLQEAIPDVFSATDSVVGEPLRWVISGRGIVRDESSSSDRSVL